MTVQDWLIDSKRSILQYENLKKTSKCLPLEKMSGEEVNKCLFSDIYEKLLNYIIIKAR